MQDEDPHLAELDEYLRECININPENIQEEYIRIPGHLAYWNARYAAAQRSYLRAKHDLDIMHGKLQPLIRNGILAAGGKITEAMIDAGIETNPDYIEARERLNEAAGEEADLKGHCEAVRAKREMLVSLGAHLRIELERDPALRERTAARRHINEG